MLENTESLYMALVCDYNLDVMDTTEAACHRRGSRDNSLVYSVVSRRAGGLSIGINLFPQRKECSFDCPYCEVLPFEPGEPLSLETLEEELADEVRIHIAEPEKPCRIRDICISGNGEPTLSPHLPAALEIAAKVRRNAGLDPAQVPLRMITNSTGFLKKDVVSGLRAFHKREGLSIWAKLDAGSDAWFRSISGSTFGLDELTDAITDFSCYVPITIQTMLCRIGDRVPDRREATAFAARLNGMMQRGAQIEALHFYTISRIPVDLRTSALTDDEVLAYMLNVSDNLEHTLPHSGYGANGLLPLRLE